MQSTGQTSIQASQPVQLSARMTASSFGNFLRALPAAFAMNEILHARYHQYIGEPSTGMLAAFGRNANPIRRLWAGCWRSREDWAGLAQSAQAWPGPEGCRASLLRAPPVWWRRSA